MYWKRKMALDRPVSSGYVRYWNLRVQKRSFDDLGDRCNINSNNRFLGFLATLVRCVCQRFAWNLRPYLRVDQCWWRLTCIYTHLGVRGHLSTADLLWHRSFSFLNLIQEKHWNRRSYSAPLLKVNSIFQIYFALRIFRAQKKFTLASIVVIRFKKAASI